MEIALFAALALIVAVALALAAGPARMARRVRALEARLDRAPAPRDVSERLPDRVRDFALRGDATPTDLAARVHLTQRAEFQPKPAAPWMLLEARQSIAIGAPGFVWEARQDVGPLPKLRGFDAFVDGTGLLRMQLFGLIPAARAEGPITDRAEAMRYLAELPWAPDAILGNPSLSWRMDGPDWAVVTMEVPGGPVSARFRFDSGGDIVEMLAKDRPSTDAAGQPIFQTWRGCFRNYRMIGPRRVPAEGEVGYVFGDTYRPYFQGRITGYETVH
ncbi:hypothetical protein P1J78_20590 [Psychromarinibacter sp. C21-152]|uniref:Uncharacterized protein n=1 Tax=Psychromarinibacter sediminicola TaxID=3033385 RepID=A0AAE3NW73_9RHOB|nr:DUF6544 family protein [Psychromarinibacter sediminicola]MDF0603151.1 hypothetical protein [Psychromarinibacter sediminicola]